MGPSVHVPEVKQREAMQKERDAEYLDRQAVETEKNFHRHCKTLLYNGRQRGMVERERDIEQRGVAKMAEKLSVFKWEVANCEKTAWALREETGLKGQS